MPGDQGAGRGLLVTDQSREPGEVLHHGAPSLVVGIEQFAVAGHPQFEVNRMELTRAGRSFTVDTLREIHAQDPSRELFFLIGADSLAELPSWRDPAGIVELATIVAVNRGDRPLPDLDALRRTLGNAVADRIRIVTMPGIDLSSTDIRRRVREGRSIRFMTPRPCEVYIHEHGLYTGRVRE